MYIIYANDIPTKFFSAKKYSNIIPTKMFIIITIVCFFLGGWMQTNLRTWVLQ